MAHMQSLLYQIFPVRNLGHHCHVSDVRIALIVLSTKPKRVRCGAAPICCKCNYVSFVVLQTISMFNISYNSRLYTLTLYLLLCVLCTLNLNYSMYWWRNCIDGTKRFFKQLSQSFMLFCGLPACVLCCCIKINVIKCYFVADADACFYLVCYLNVVIPLQCRTSLSNELQLSHSLPIVALQGT